MTTLTVGIIGCGRMGRGRARCARLAGSRIARVYDADPRRAEVLAAPYEGIVVSSPDDLLECDAVFLCTPPDARPDLALAAARAGTPFFAEKPLAVNHQAAEQVLRELETRGFLDAVRSRSVMTIRSDWNDALQTQRVVDAAHSSALQGVRA